MDSLAPSPSVKTPNQSERASHLSQATGSAAEEDDDKDRAQLLEHSRQHEPELLDRLLARYYIYYISTSSCTNKRACCLVTNLVNVFYLFTSWLSCIACINYSS
jgi:hypothetical protein